MAHVNEGSVASDNEHTDFILYPIVEDSCIYPHQYSQTQFSTSTGEIFYDARSTAPEVDFTAMLSGEDSTLEELHSAPSTQITKTVLPNFYSLSDSSAAVYQSQGFCLPEAYDFHSSFIPRTIGNIFTTSAAEDSTLTAPIDENPRFLIQAPTFPLGLSLGSHTTTSDFRSTPSTSPGTSIAGFEGPGSINSAISLGSAEGSTRGSPYSNHEDLWSAGVPDGVENLDQEQGYWAGSEFIDPQELTHTSPPHTLSDEPASSVASPHLSPTPPRLTSNPPSPIISRKKIPGRLSPLASGRSHPTFPYPPPRRDSIKSNSSSRGSKSPRLDSSDDSLRMRSPSSPTSQQPPAGRDAQCPECSKTFRDMRAHLLTHKLERPEKCPIATCEYSKKGFARKYDCQRHTLTHYKGTMVCGFCPCAGSPAEKSFNRADVFKRHLMSVHNVEQTAPNGRKKTTSTLSTSQTQRSPTSGRPTDRFGDFQGTGKCSTCSGTFSTAQQFYEHLDDCVYSKVVQEEPAAAYNEMNLSQIKLEDIADSLVSPWKGRRSKSSESEEKAEDEDEDEDEELGDAEEDAEDKDEKDETWTLGRNASKQLLKPNGLGRTPSTRSKTAVSKTTIKRGVRYRISKITARDGKPRARRSGKKRKNFPAGWGCSAEQMVTKRRCLMVYDGPSILCKDEMMMNTEWEVRASMGGDNFVSDLDFWTMQRANAALDAGINVEVR